MIAGAAQAEIGVGGWPMICIVPSQICTQARGQRVNPGIPVTHNVSPAPTPAPRAGADADAGASDKSDDVSEQASDLDYFLQLLLGLAPTARGLAPAGGVAQAVSGDDVLPPDGKKLPPASDDSGQVLLKFTPVLPLTQVVILGAAGGSSTGALSKRVEGALRQLGGEQKSIPAALRQLVQAQTTAAGPADPHRSAIAAPSPQGAQLATTAPVPPSGLAHASAIPVGSPDFGGALVSRVQWMARNDLQFARIDLSPAHLGPLEIHIHLDGDKAQVTFAAHHAMTRDALEAAVPRLRVLLGDSGLQLVQVNVGQQGMTDRDQRPYAHGAGGAVTATGPSEAIESGAMRSVQTGLRQGLVDDYA